MTEQRPIDRVRARLERAEEEFPKLAAPDGTVAIQIDDLRAVLDAADKLACTVRRIYAEKLPDSWFVCGEGGAKDRNGLPTYIDVCPAYGVGWSQVYERSERTIGGM